MMKHGQISVEFMITVTVVLVIAILMGAIIYQKHTEFTNVKIEVQGKKVTDSIADHINKIFTAGKGYSVTFSLPEQLYGDTQYMVAFYRNEPRVEVTTDNGFSWSRPLATHEICCGRSLCNCTDNNTACFFNVNARTRNIKVRNRNGLVIIGENPLVTFNLTLVPGLNLISLPIEPDNMSVEAIFGNVSNMTDVRTLNTWGLPEGGLDDLQAIFAEMTRVNTMELDKGYLVNFTDTQNATISIAGRQICKPCCINRIFLHNRFNLVGWSSNQPRSINETSIGCFDPPADKIYSLTPGTGSIEVYAPPDFKNFTTFNPGRGYIFYFNNCSETNSIWNYNPC